MQSLMSTLNDAADGVLGFLGDLTDFGRLLDQNWQLKRMAARGIEVNAQDVPTARAVPLAEFT